MDILVRDDLVAVLSGRRHQYHQVNHCRLSHNAPEIDNADLYRWEVPKLFGDSIILCNGFAVIDEIIATSEPMPVTSIWSL